MPIEFKTADMFAIAEAINAEAIVNTVNCVGIMGKGVALAFKKRWKKNYTEYKKICEKRELHPGTMFVFQNADILNQKEPKFIINFPTKDHWRSPSKLSFIKSGLDAFAKEIKRRNIKSVVMPALGCGNGGLDWAEVKPLIIHKLSALAEAGTHIIVIEPAEAIKKLPKITFDRALILTFIDRLTSREAFPLNKDSVALIMYYLQIYGAKFNLKFSKRGNMPRSPELENIFKAFEKMNLIEFKEENITLSDEGKMQTQVYLRNKVRESEDIEKLWEGLINLTNNVNKIELIARTLILWLNRERNKDLDQIAKAFKNKPIKKFYPYIIDDSLILSTVYKSKKITPILNLR